MRLPLENLEQLSMGGMQILPPVWGISQLRSGCLNALTFQIQYKNPETSQITKF